MPPVLSRPRVTVVSHQRWRAADLSRVVDVRLDHGLDTDAAADPAAVLWAPGAWAAAAVSRYRHLRLSSAGPRWLDCAPLAVTGREVFTCTAGGLRCRPPVSAEVFAKLPETKHAVFPAGIRTPAQLRADLDPLPDEELVQVQTPVRFDSEVRCWVLDGQVVTRASYFPDLAREDWPDFDDPARATAAVCWLEAVLAAGLVQVPPAVVIDVGWCANPASGVPGWRVVEANAAWSSDWYTPTDLSAVVMVLAASQVGVSDRWRWQPSQLLVNSARGLARR